MLTRIDLDFPADPVALLRRLADRPGLSALVSRAAAADFGGFSFVACEPVGIVRSLDPLAGGAARGSADALGFVPRFIGVLPFEAFRALERPAWVKEDTRAPAMIERIEWLEYAAVLVVDHVLEQVFAVGKESAARALAGLVSSRADPGPTSFQLRARDAEAPELHVERVRTAIERIWAGDLYQVNLARRLALALEPADGAARVALLEALCDAFPTPFGALISLSGGQTVVTSTPELLLDASPRVDGFDTLVTEPIKGTRRRSPDHHDDDAVVRELDQDPKERAELAMIIDVERNDLARVCVPGSVVIERPPHVVAHSTVFHRVARLRGQVRAGVSRQQVLEALVPSGSVTGAPKVKAMELIRELEPVRRGLYTGGLGYLGWDGSLRLAMAIRTLVLGPSGEGEYLVGGGIVESSDPERELSETRWKSAQLEAISAGRLRRPLSA